MTPEIGIALFLFLLLLARLASRPQAEHTYKAKFGDSF